MVLMIRQSEEKVSSGDQLYHVESTITATRQMRGLKFACPEMMARAGHELPDEREVAFQQMLRRIAGFWVSTDAKSDLRQHLRGWESEN